MRLLIVEHEADSGIGLLEQVARTRGHDLETVGTSDMPTSVDRCDALVVLGSEWSVNDPQIGEWFSREIALIRDAHDRGVPVLGVCFGAQALAVALGGSVGRAARPEIGWHTIHTDEPDLVEAGPWFQWHVDAITAPPGAIEIARSRVCLQAFRIGPNLGVQFHPEAELQQATDWSRADPANVVATGQSAESIVAETLTQVEAARGRAGRLFDRFCRHATLVPRPASGGRSPADIFIGWSCCGPREPGSEDRCA